MADAPFGARSRGCFYYSRALRLRLVVSDEAGGRSHVVQLYWKPSSGWIIVAYVSLNGLERLPTPLLEAGNTFQFTLAAGRAASTPLKIIWHSGVPDDCGLKSGPFRSGRHNSHAVKQVAKALRRMFVSIADPPRAAG